MSLNWSKKDLTSQKFGRLTVISDSKIRYSNGLILWNCICDCGNKVVVNGASLRNGKSQSCGCLHLELKRLPKYEASFNKLYKTYQTGAIKRGYEFKLTKDEFKDITSKECFYCGIIPTYECRNNGKKSKFYGNYIYNGIDRIDNNNGYNIENCIPCCFKCNKMKSTLKRDEFIAQCIQISNYVNISRECLGI
jgi:hypothetical protein